MVLFKDIETVYNAWKQGFDLKDLQIGGLGAGPGRKAVYQNMTLDEKDYKLLNELSRDVNIFFQATPEDNKKLYNSVAENISF